MLHGIYLAILLVTCMKQCESNHFRGGSISWAPVDAGVTFPASQVEVSVTTRFFWEITSFSTLCDSSASVAAGALFGDNSFINPNNGDPWSLSTLTNCFAFNADDKWSEGVRTQKVYITTTEAISASFASCCWITGIVSVSGRDTWNLTFVMDLRQRADTNRVNSSPTTDIVPFVKLSTGCVSSQSLVIPVKDADGDLVRCRCAGNTCLTGFTIDSDACIMYLNPSLTGYYALEVVLEDYARGASSGTPLSSVPLQFIAYVLEDTSFCCKCFVCFNLWVMWDCNFK